MIIHRYECSTCGNIDIRQTVGTIPVTEAIVGDVEAHRVAHGMCPECGLPAGWFAGNSNDAS